MNFCLAIVRFVDEGDDDDGGDDGGGEDELDLFVLVVNDVNFGCLSQIEWFVDGYDDVDTY